MCLIDNHYYLSLSQAIEFDWSQEESPAQVEEDLWEDSLFNVIH